MRTIKFRAWYGDGTGFDYQPTIWDGRVWNPVEDREDKGVVIQQFTGLKDKNGKEIYEGDIVGKGKAIVFGEVVYHEERAMYIIHDEENFNEPLHYDIILYEVIGNIYENSELL